MISYEMELKIRILPRCKHDDFHSDCLWCADGLRVVRKVKDTLEQLHHESINPYNKQAHIIIDIEAEHPQ